MVSSLITDVMSSEVVPLTENGKKTEVDRKEKKITIETKTRSLNYYITESPGIALTIFFSLQQVLSSISGSLTITLLIAELVCAERDEIFKGRLLCTALFMSGAATTIQCVIGTRLPLYQGPAVAYIIPLIAMMELPEWKCPKIDFSGNGTVNDNSSLLTYSSREELTMHRLQMLMGPLMVVGVLHMSFGMFGLIGYLLKYIGPITVVPAVTLLTFYLYVIASDLSETQWGVAALTAAMCVFLTLFLAKKMTPIPYWTRKKGFHIFYYPLHQVLAILISVVVGWIVSAILTQAGVFSEDPESIQYFARTDSRNYVIAASNWFFFPYPFQFGSPKFNSGVLIAFLLATITSILDSIGDYYACASTAKAPLPPTHAINRGIAAEGFATLLAGLVGAGHATTTYGGNIGVIGVTKVASRRVFIVTGVVFMILGVIGKVGAVLVTIPYSVLGGMLIVALGIFIGVVLSNLKHIDLSSTRNMAIIGLALIVGLICPYYFQNHPDAIKTGNEQLDNALLMMFGNPNFAGTVVACFLDNAVPGTMEERGMLTWLNDGSSSKDDIKDADLYETTEEVYGIPFLPKFISKSRFASKIPFLPGYNSNGVSS